MDMTPIAAGAFAKVLEKATGQELVAGRRWRIETALGPVLRAHDIDTLDQLAVRLGREEEEWLAKEVVEALLNHETFFFRDMPAFRALIDEALPVIAAERTESKRLRIWSAGCSTGQEAYSLAIALVGASSRWQGWDLSVLGTDVSHQAIARAREGLYSQLEIQRGLPITDMIAWFESEGDSWRARKELRGAVSFAPHNLMDPAPGLFDVILCRNVMLYFAPETRRVVLERLSQALAPDGLLFLGAGETLIGLGGAFEADPVLRGFYRPRRR